MSHHVLTLGIIILANSDTVILWYVPFNSNIREITKTAFFHLFIIAKCRNILLLRGWTVVIPHYQAKAPSKPSTQPKRQISQRSYFSHVSLLSLAPHKSLYWIYNPSSEWSWVIRLHCFLKTSTYCIIVALCALCVWTADLCFLEFPKVELPVWIWKRDSLCLLKFDFKLK